jgi:hypothetical protein
MQVTLSFPLAESFMSNHQHESFIKLQLQNFDELLNNHITGWSIAKITCSALKRLTFFTS